MLKKCSRAGEPARGRAGFLAKRPIDGVRVIEKDPQIA
jgi:hypothetical protein